MLTTKLVDSIDSPGITAVLPIPRIQKLIVANENNDIHVYYRDSIIYKHFQTYPNLLKTLHTEESKIYGLDYSHEISTIFARCEKTIILLNSSNLLDYDQIIDNRGIENSWIFEIQSQKKDEIATILLYSTKKSAKLRMLVWHARVYKEMFEVSLPNKNERIFSVESEKSGLLLTTKYGVYHWNYNQSLLTRIDRIVKRKYPNGLVRAIMELETLCQSLPSYSTPDNEDKHSIQSTSRMSKKSSISSFWNRNQKKKDSSIRNLRYVYKRSAHSPLVIIDGITNNLFEVEINLGEEPYLIATDYSQFMEWNHNFLNVKLASSNILIFYNSIELRFVDSDNGFTFLSKHIQDGIKDVFRMDGPYFIVWTVTDQLQLFHYQVDDSYDQSFIDEESIYGNVYDVEFYQLWRKVSFYKFFLLSTNSVALCASSDPESSLDLCAMKLRDLSVMLCLQVYDRYTKCMDILIYNNLNTERIKILQSCIIKNIFDNFIIFWAPPQLIITKVFPKNISYSVFDTSNEIKQYKLGVSFVNNNFEVPSNVLVRWYLPYLTDIRRQIRNLLNPDFDGRIIWSIMGRNISQTIDFFLIDDHGEADVKTILRLIDTTLFSSYLHYQPSLLGPLLRVENFCDNHIVTHELKSHKLYEQLIDFYYIKGRHGDALGLLKDLYHNVGFGYDNSLKYGIRYLVVGYLKRLSDEELDLIFHYCNWLIDNFEDHKDILISIFMDDSQVCADRDHLKIFDFIKRIDEEISIQYLEFIISSFLIQNPDIYQILIIRYLNDLSTRNTRAKLRSLLDTNSIYDPNKALTLLHDFIHKTKIFRPELYFLKHLQVYALRRLGRHKDAINILFKDLSDYNGTSQYCNDVYESNEKERLNILSYFFNCIISYQSDSQLSNILYFLKEYRSKMDTITILKMIPEEFAMTDLKDILIQAVKSNSIRKNEVLLSKNLFQTELISTSYNLNRAQADFSIIKEGDICPICRKVFPAFTTDTIFLISNGDQNKVTHYNCGKAFQSHSDNKYSITSIQPQTLGVIKDKEAPKGD